MTLLQIIWSKRKCQPWGCNWEYLVLSRKHTYTASFLLTATCMGLISSSTAAPTAHQSTVEGTMRLLCSYCMCSSSSHSTVVSEYPHSTHKGTLTCSRVGILARLRVIDPLFFLWTHKFQLKLTITRPLERACFHSGVKISHGKSLTISHFCPANYQNIELHVLN